MLSLISLYSAVESKAAYGGSEIGVFKQQTSFFWGRLMVRETDKCHFFLSVQYTMFIYRFFKRWRKNPRWSFSCCLALLLPLNDLQQEILGMTGENVLAQQLPTGNVDMASLPGALKESGAVSIELTIFPEHPEETSESPLKETETCPKKKENADKGAVSTVEEPEKQMMTGKGKMKQPLQTDNVSKSSASGVLKKSGAVRTVHASIQECPKKTRGSLTKENKAVPKEERNADKMPAFEKGHKQEKNCVAQENLQQEIREMGSKNPLKRQLQTGNANTPSESETLKKIGAVRIAHASIHECPKKTRGSGTKEKEAAKKKERISNKLAFDKDEAPEKYGPPQDNVQREIREMRSKIPLKQQLQTGKVNTSPESAALKKSGAADFVLVTIHEYPKEACGSPSKERGKMKPSNERGEMKQGDDNQVATNTPEVELEETCL